MNTGIYRGAPYQRGYGLGGTFKRFFNWIVPHVKKHALPAIESGAKVVGRTALSTAADIAKDVSSGRNFKEAAEERIDSAVESLKEKAEKSFSGKGINRRRKMKKLTFIQKKKIQDIFDKN